MDSSKEPPKYKTSQELLENEEHVIKLTASPSGDDIYIEYSTRLALREFALSLLREADTGSGWAEFYHLSTEGGPALVVNGARLTPDSSRVFLYSSSKNKNFSKAKV